VLLRSKNMTLGALGVDAKSGRLLSENDRYLMGILADFTAVALINAQVIADLKAQRAGPPEQPANWTGSLGGGVPVPDLTGSITEAERLSRELRDLAAAAQLLAAKLQGLAGSG
jgi:hypothetical protein